MSDKLLTWMVIAIWVLVVALLVFMFWRPATQALPSGNQATVAE